MAVPTNRVTGDTVQAGDLNAIATLLNATETSAAANATAVSSKAASSDARFTDQRVPTDASVTNAKVAAAAAISLDKTADSATRLALLAAERTKLTGIATAATANSTDAALRDRQTHTGLYIIAADLIEAVEDTAAALFTTASHTGITASYNDTLRTLALTATGGTAAPSNPSDLWISNGNSRYTGWDGADQTLRNTAFANFTADVVVSDMIVGRIPTTSGELTLSVAIPWDRGISWIGGSPWSDEFGPAASSAQTRIKTSGATLFSHTAGSVTLLHGRMQNIQFVGNFSTSTWITGSGGEFRDVKVRDCSFKGFKSIIDGTMPCTRVNMTILHVNNGIGPQFVISGSDNAFYFGFMAQSMFPNFGEQFLLLNSCEYSKFGSTPGEMWYITPDGPSQPVELTGSAAGIELFVDGAHINGLGSKAHDGTAATVAALPAPDLATTKGKIYKITGTVRTGWLYKSRWDGAAWDWEIFNDYNVDLPAWVSGTTYGQGATVISAGTMYIQTTTASTNNTVAPTNGTNGWATLNRTFAGSATKIPTTYPTLQSNPVTGRIEGRFWDNTNKTGVGGYHRYGGVDDPVWYLHKETGLGHHDGCDNPAVRLVNGSGNVHIHPFSAELIALHPSPGYEGVVYASGWSDGVIVVDRIMDQYIPTSRYLIVAEGANTVVELGFYVPTARIKRTGGAIVRYPNGTNA